MREQSANLSVAITGALGSLRQGPTHSSCNFSLLSIYLASLGGFPSTPSQSHVSSLFPVVSSRKHGLCASCPSLFDIHGHHHLAISANQSRRPLHGVITNRGKQGLHCRARAFVPAERGSALPSLSLTLIALVTLGRANIWQKFGFAELHAWLRI